MSVSLSAVGDNQEARRTKAVEDNSSKFLRISLLLIKSRSTK